MSSTVTEVAKFVAPNAATNFVALFNLRDAQELRRKINDTSPEDAYKVLETIGKSRVLTELSMGVLSIELAIANGLPPIHVKRWIKENISREDLAIAREAFAEACVLKAQLVLTAEPRNMQEAQVNKELSARYQWMAERVDANNWGPPKKDTPVPPAARITFNMQGSQPSGVTIDVDASSTSADALAAPDPARELGPQFAGFRFAVPSDQPVARGGDIPDGSGR